MPRADGQPVVGQRSFGGGVLTSTDLPKLAIRIDPRLSYIGATDLAIKGIARADRHHFIDADGSRVRRLLVVQFERFLPSSDEVYRYPLADPVSLGGTTWGSWVFAYDVEREEPEPSPETLDTVRFLGEHGLELAREQVMARYARIVGDDARHEVLVFYHEPLDRLGHTLATVAGEGRLRPVFASVGVELQARARRAFEVVP